MNKLTIRQEEFIKETIKTLNPTEAVKRTYNLGGKGGKKLEQTARSIASENLTKPAIIKKFQEILDDVDDQWIIDEIKKIAKQEGDTRPKLQALDMLLSLKGRYPNQKNEADFIETMKRINE